jgi:hypothetical protein
MTKRYSICFEARSYNHHGDGYGGALSVAVVTGSGSHEFSAYAAAGRLWDCCREVHWFAASNLIMSLRVTVTHFVVTGGPPPPMCQAA